MPVVFRTGASNSIGHLIQYVQMFLRFTRVVGNVKICLATFPLLNRTMLYAHCYIQFYRFAITLFGRGEDTASNLCSERHGAAPVTTETDVYPFACKVTYFKSIGFDFFLGRYSTCFP